jgi:GT2 family glycosyltransferase
MTLPVAVLIVNYKIYEDLARTLASLEPFIRPDDQIVVVDQASDADEMRRLCLRRHPQVTWIPTTENIGFAAAVNLGVRQSTAPYLLLLNPDAMLEGPVPEVLERWLRDHPDTAVVGPRVLNMDGTTQASARRFPGPTTALAGRSTWLTTRFPDNWLSRRNLPGRMAVEQLEVDWLAGSCFMTPRAVFTALGGFDDGFFLYWEDADYCRRATDRGLRCVYLPTVAVRHAGGRSVSLDPAPAIRAFHKSAYRLYLKHAGPVGRLFAPLTQMGLWLRGEVRARRASAQIRARRDDSANR